MSEMMSGSLIGNYIKKFQYLLTQSVKKQKQMSTQLSQPNQQLIEMSIQLFKQTLEIDELTFQQYFNDKNFEAYLKCIQRIGLLLTTNYLSRQKDHLQQIETLNSKYQNINQKLSHYIDQNLDLKNMLEHYQNQRQIYDQQLNKSEHEIERGKHQILSQNQTRQLLLKQNQNLIQNNQYLLNQNATLQAEIQKLSKSLTQQKQETLHFKQKLAQIKTSLQAAQTQIDTLKQQNFCLSKQIESLNLLLQQKDYLLGNKIDKEKQDIPMSAQHNYPYYVRSNYVVKQQNQHQQEYYQDKQVLKDIEEQYKPEEHVMILDFAKSIGCSEDRDHTTSINVEYIQGIIQSQPDQDQHIITNEKNDVKLRPMKSDRKQKDTTENQPQLNKSLVKIQTKIKSRQSLKIPQTPKFKQPITKQKSMTSKVNRIHCQSQQKSSKSFIRQKNASAQHKYIPRSHVSVILNSKTHQQHDFSKFAPNNKKGKIEHSHSVQDFSYEGQVQFEDRQILFQRQLKTRQRMINDLKIQNRSVRRLAQQQSQKRTQVQLQYEQSVQKLKSLLEFYKEQVKKLYKNYVLQKTLSQAYQNELIQVQQQFENYKNLYQKTAKELRQKCVQEVQRHRLMYEEKYQQVKAHMMRMQKEMREMERIISNHNSSNSGNDDSNASSGQKSNKSSEQKSNHDDSNSKINNQYQQKMKMIRSEQPSRIKEYQQGSQEITKQLISPRSQYSLFPRQIKHHSHNASQQYSVIIPISRGDSKNTSVLINDEEENSLSKDNLINVKDYTGRFFGRQQVQDRAKHYQEQHEVLFSYRSENSRKQFIDVEVQTVLSILHYVENQQEQYDFEQQIEQDQQQQSIPLQYSENYITQKDSQELTTLVGMKSLEHSNIRPFAQLRQQAKQQEDYYQHRVGNLNFVFNLYQVTVYGLVMNKKYSELGLISEGITLQQTNNKMKNNSNTQAQTLMQTLNQSSTEVSMVQLAKTKNIIQPIQNALKQVQQKQVQTVNIDLIDQETECYQLNQGIVNVQFGVECLPELKQTLTQTQPEQTQIQKPQEKAQCVEMESKYSQCQYSCIDTHTSQSQTERVTLKDSQSQILTIVSQNSSQTQTDQVIMENNQSQSMILQMSSVQMQTHQLIFNCMDSQTDALTLNSMDSQTDLLVLISMDSQTDLLACKSEESQTYLITCNSIDSQTNSIAMSSIDSQASLSINLQIVSVISQTIIRTVQKQDQSSEINIGIGEHYTQTDLQQVIKKQQDQSKITTISKEIQTDFINYYQQKLIEKTDQQIQNIQQETTNYRRNTSDYQLRRNTSDATEEQGEQYQQQSKQQLYIPEQGCAIIQSHWQQTQYNRQQLSVQQKQQQHNQQYQLNSIMQYRQIENNSINTEQMQEEGHVMEQKLRQQHKNSKTQERGYSQFNQPIAIEYQLSPQPLFIDHQMQTQQLTLIPSYFTRATQTNNFIFNNSVNNPINYAQIHQQSSTNMNKNYRLTNIHTHKSQTIKNTQQNRIQHIQPQLKTPMHVSYVIENKSSSSLLQSRNSELIDSMLGQLTETIDLGESEIQTIKNKLYLILESMYQISSQNSNQPHLTQQRAAHQSFIIQQTSVRSIVKQNSKKNINYSSRKQLQIQKKLQQQMEEIQMEEEQKDRLQQNELQLQNQPQQKVQESQKSSQSQRQSEEEILSPKQTLTDNNSNIPRTSFESIFKENKFTQQTQQVKASVSTSVSTSTSLTMSLSFHSPSLINSKHMALLDQNGLRVNGFEIIDEVRQIQRQNNEDSLIVRNVQDNQSQKQGIQEYENQHQYQGSVNRSEQNNIQNQRKQLDVQKFTILTHQQPLIKVSLKQAIISDRGQQDQPTREVERSSHYNQIELHQNHFQRKHKLEMKQITVERVNEHGRRKHLKRSLRAYELLIKPQELDFISQQQFNTIAMEFKLNKISSSLRHVPSQQQAQQLSLNQIIVIKCYPLDHQQKLNRSISYTKQNMSPNNININAQQQEIFILSLTKLYSLTHGYSFATKNNKLFKQNTHLNNQLVLGNQEIRLNQNVLKISMTNKVNHFIPSFPLSFSYEQILNCLNATHQVQTVYMYKVN